MTDPHPPIDPSETQLLDSRYQLEAVIGRGGMGAVYRGLDLRLDRIVAVKVLADAPDADVERFRAEVRMLARFVHPHLVRLLDAGESDDRLYLVMDLVDGESLATRNARGPLAPSEAAKMGAAVMSALFYVHNQGVVHRDVKPGNILLDREGDAWLADFGIARLVDSTQMTATGVAIGTPAYLAPEQVQGIGVGPSADVYALGLVLIECLTGRRAFSGTPAEIMAARLQRDPVVPAELDSAWRSVLVAMTERDPAARPSDELALARLVEMEHASNTTAPPGTATTRPSSIAPVPTEPFGGPTIDTSAQTSTSRATTNEELPRRARYSPRRGALAGLAAAVLAGGALLGLVVSGAFSSAPKQAAPPGIPEVSSTSTSTTTSSTTTTLPTTTSSVPTSTTTATTTTLPSVASAAGALVSAIEGGVSSGSISPQAGQQLTNQLQPLLFSPHPETAQQQAQQFDQLVHTFDHDVAHGQIDSSGNQVVGSALDSLAGALGTSVPTSTTKAPPPPKKHHDQ